MPQYSARVTFNNVMNHKHGSTGTLTVDAVNADEARYKLKERASQNLHGTTMFQDYMTVSDLREEKR